MARASDGSIGGHWDDKRTPSPAATPEAPPPANEASVEPQLDAADTLAAIDKPATVPELEAAWPTIPGYRILSRLGQGGMGIVYKAEQLGLNRIVAIKTVCAAIAGQSLTRFRAEAKAAAKLCHPNIVQIYEVGDHDGLPFFSMEYVSGGTLSDRLTAEPEPIRWAAHLVADLADAVQAAHAAGIIHRDLKPSNILLQEEEPAPPSADTGPGKPVTLDRHACVPKISDFGVAKQLDQTVGITISGALIGTPSYMAPEQAEGRSADVGPACDIHALGVILYRLITGQLPFKGDNMTTTLALVGSHEPISPYRLNRRIHRDLETICLKCLRKVPAQRYASAEALAADLRRFLAGEPIEARPIGPVERLWTWCVRSPAVALATVVSLLLVLVFLPGWWWYQSRLEEMRVREEITDKLLKASEELARTKEYFALLNHARQRNAGRPRGWTWAGLADLQKAAALSSEARNDRELAIEAATCLGGIDIRPGAVWADELPQVMIAFSGDGKRLAIADYRAPGHGLSCTVRLFDAQTGRQLRRLSFPSQLVWKKSLQPVPDGARSLTFNRQGDELFVGSRSGQVHHWRLADAKERPTSWRVFAKQPVDWLLTAPDGASVVVGSTQSQSIARWSIGAAKPAAQVQLKTVVWQLSPAPGPGEALLACEAEDQIQFRDAMTLAVAPGRPVLPSLAPFAFDQTGDMIVGDRADRLHFAYVPTGAIVRSLADPDTGMTHRATDLICFNRDASLVLSLGYGDDDRLLLLWETAGGRLLAKMPLPGKDFAHAAFHPDKDELIVANDGKVQAHDIGGLRVQQRLANQPLRIMDFDFLPGGELVCAAVSTVSEVSDGKRPLRAFTCWDKSTGRPLIERFRLSQPTSADAPCRITVNPRLNEVAALAPPDGVECWDLDAGKPRRLAMPEATHLAFDREGTRLWTILDERQTLAAATFPELKKIATWQDAGRIHAGTGELYSLAVGKTLVALGSRDGMVHLVRTDDVRRHSELPGSSSPVRSVAIDPQERLVAAGFQDGIIRLYDIGTGGVIVQLADHTDWVQALSFSPDGKLLATGSRDGAVHLYAVGRGGKGGGGSRALERLITFRSRPIAQLRFHPDGTALAVLMQQEHAVRLWRLDALQKHLRDLGIELPQ